MHNVRSIYITGKTAQVKKGETEKVILYSGREDWLHQEGVEAMLSIRAKGSLMEWKPINERLVYLRLYTLSFVISLIVVGLYSRNDSSEETKNVLRTTTKCHQ